MGLEWIPRGKNLSNDFNVVVEEARREALDVVKAYSDAKEKPAF